MSPRLKLAGVAAIVAVVLLGGGWLWGASGRWPAERALDAMTLSLDLSDARGAALRARVDLYNLNFGEASRDLELAKAPLRRAAAVFERSGGGDPSRLTTEALSHIDEAQVLSNKLDQAANSAAAQVVKALDDIDVARRH